MTIERVLVANRGEIALRVFRTCAKLGIETVAVVAPDDRGSLHSRSASAVVEVPSYLDADALVAAATATRANAIHPGYGFLAESPSFAETTAAAGLTWIGPPPAALRLGGDKVEARRIAAGAGLRVLSGGEAADVGLPLLVKAAGGGGGRGMRLVTSADALDDQLAAASREAEAAFGDATIYCERYLARGRHVEVQLVGDAHGKVIALGDRDCSVQRRHQKVVEEAPAPSLHPAVRKRLAEDAVAFGQAIAFQGAGTVEFLLDGNDAYFLELNGRIQVEHPVTELVTGLDLVELQIRIAEGEPTDDGPTGALGHAIEARLYAEDSRTFSPRSGTVTELELPHGIRVDAGVAEGQEIGTRYDSLLAKLVAHGPTRADACARLATALASTRVGGVETNLAFLRWLIDHPAFRAGRLSTAFLIDHPPLSRTPLLEPDLAWLIPWRLNLPSPFPALPPDIETGTHAPSGTTGGRLFSPMPGLVLDVLVDEGDAVDVHQSLVVIEAMKLEHPVVAPFASTVTAILVAPGDQVAAGDALVELG